MLQVKAPSREIWLKIMLRRGVGRTKQVISNKGWAALGAVNQAKPTCKPTHQASNQAKIRIHLKTAPKILANSHPILANSKATPIHLSLARGNNLASNPERASNPVNAKAKVSPA